MGQDRSQEETIWHRVSADYRGRLQEVRRKAIIQVVIKVVGRLPSGFRTPCTPFCKQGENLQ